MRLDHQVIELVGIGAAAVPGDAFAAVHRAPLRVLLDEGIVARLLHQARDFVDGGIPRDIFPMVRPRTAHLRLQQAAGIIDVLLQRRALGTQRAAIDGMVGIALHVDHLRRHVLGLVAEGVDDDAATDRAVRAGGSRLGGARNLQLARLCVGGFQVEAQDAGYRAARADLQERSSCMHALKPFCQRSRFPVWVVGLPYFWKFRNCLPPGTQGCRPASWPARSPGILRC